MSSRAALLLPLLFACSDYELSPKDDVPGGQDSEPGTCASWEPAQPYGVAQNQDCVAEPTVGSFTPVVEWQWASNPLQPGFDDLMASPAIANLNDDNGDGLVNEDDIPDVVFASFANGAYTSAGAITAISGDGSGTHWSVTNVGGHGFYASSGVALGDLEGDGVMEVCASGTSAALVCFSVVDGVPELKFAAGTGLYGYGCPAIADFDADGLAEVAFGRQIFSHDGTLLGTGAHGVGGRYMSSPVDWDGDGQLELVAGDAVYELDGSALWYDGLGDGVPAVGNFDGDPEPEVVRTTGGTLLLSDNDGAVIWQVAVPGGGGGPPTVADFDGDGEAEVGVAGRDFYTVFNTDGGVLWSRQTQDHSSSVTGSSVFDFQGDGRAEVVYADELNLWVYDGSNGETLLQLTDHASGTLMEYPLIADVDHDGSTEIILASNNYAFNGWNGITVIGDADSSWAPARAVWNQFAYHITNVNNDGSIPVNQEANWASWNNFRAGGTELGPGHWRPDLRPGQPELCEAECHAQVVSVAVPVENLGLVAAQGVSLRLYNTSNGGRVLVIEDQVDVPPGEAVIAGPYALTQAEWGTGALEVVLDEEGAAEECDESNNSADLAGWPC